MKWCLLEEKKYSKSAKGLYFCAATATSAAINLLSTNFTAQLYGSILQIYDYQSVTLAALCSKHQASENARDSTILTFSGFFFPIFI